MDTPYYTIFEVFDIIALLFDVLHCSRWMLICRNDYNWIFVLTEVYDNCTHTLHVHIRGLARAYHGDTICQRFWLVFAGSRTARLLRILWTMRLWCFVSFHSWFETSLWFSPSLNPLAIGWSLIYRDCCVPTIVNPMGSNCKLEAFSASELANQPCIHDITSTS